MTKEELRNKKVAVLGAGIEGLALIEFLKSTDADISIRIEKPESEIEKIELEKIQSLSLPTVFGKNAFDDLDTFDVIFRSPGIKRHQDALNNAASKGVTISSQTQLFFDLCPCPIIGVTGTKGKGTTSSLIYEMIKAQGFDAHLGGNIGTPPISFLEKLAPESRVVLEMSSFQLQDLTSSPHIAVMLMTTSEHLDYHTDVYEYIDAKRNILRHQEAGDFAIVNKDYPASNESDVETVGTVYKISREQNIDHGCYVHEGKIFLKMSDTEQEVIETKDVLLPGKHNLENACAAVMAATLAGVDMKNIINVLTTFKGLQYRLELVKIVNGVKYYNDSFSTTPETAIAVIEAFSEPEILILGGSSKNSDFSELGETITNAKNIKAIIGIGVEWPEIKKHITREVLVLEGAKDMHAIVQGASKIATLGDVVLLSPACASFGMFKNYKDRGDEFNKEVNKL